MQKLKDSAAADCEAADETEESAGSSEETSSDVTPSGDTNKVPSPSEEQLCQPRARMSSRQASVGLLAKNETPRSSELKPIATLTDEQHF